MDKKESDNQHERYYCPLCKEPAEIIKVFDNGDIRIHCHNCGFNPLIIFD